VRETAARFGEGKGEAAGSRRTGHMWLMLQKGHIKDMEDINETGGFYFNETVMLWDLVEKREI
jgi:hypothetical protein